MFAWVIRLVVLFAILTAVYIALSTYYRWDRKRSLRAEYKTRPGLKIKEETFVAQGLSEYDQSLRKRLLLGVFLLPISIVTLLILVATYA